MFSLFFIQGNTSETEPNLCKFSSWPKLLFLFVNHSLGSLVLDGKSNSF